MTTPVTKEALRGLVGQKVRFLVTWDAPTRRKGITERRTEAAVGTVQVDDRVEGLERYVIVTRSQSRVIPTYEDSGWVIDR